MLEQYDDAHERQRLRVELEEMLRASADELRNELAATRDKMRAELSRELLDDVMAYVGQFQASARQAARHFGDPSATTVPAVVDVQRPEQLAAFFPPRQARFRVGDSVPGLPS